MTSPEDREGAQGLLLIGSTGSIGESTIDVVRRHPERFRLVGLSAHTRWQRLVEQALEFRPAFVHVGEACLGECREALAGSGIEVLSGRQALVDLPLRDGVDTLVSAIVGTRGLEPMVRAIRAGRRIAFANKEPLVTAGGPIMEEVRRHGVSCLPIDSEHSAILQCLRGEKPEDLSRIFLTASGGPFRGWSRDRLQQVSREQALKHPTWSMGAKITTDSATLMNKALEVIEAYWLYDLGEEAIEVLVHPESIIHSMVEFRDRSVKAQLGLPDMRIPIQYALSYPDHLPLQMEPVDWLKLGSLHFEALDEDVFPAIRLARAALRQGGGAPCVLNAANEAAVESFLEGALPFHRISETVERALEAFAGHSGESLEELIALDREVRQRAGSGDWPAIRATRDAKPRQSGNL